MNDDVAALHPRVALNGTTTLDRSLDDDVELCLATGTPALAVPLSKIRRHRWEESVHAIRAAGLRVTNVVGLPRLLLDAPDAWPEAQRTMAWAVEVAAQAGAGCILQSGRPGALDHRRAEAALVTALAPVGERARRLGVPLAFEPSHPLRRDLGFVHSLRDALDLAERVDLGICVELNNCWVEWDLPELFRRGAGWFQVVQVSDFVVGTTDTPDRVVPGDGDIPLPQLLRGLVDAGYRGCFELELVGPRITAEGSAVAAARGLRWLDGQLVALGA